MTKLLAHNNPWWIPPFGGRLCLIGDTHGSFKFLSRQLTAAAKEQLDTAIVLGDFGWWPPDPQVTHFGLEAMEEADRLGIRLAFLDGNHEHHVDLRNTVRKAREEQNIDTETYPVWLGSHLLGASHQQGLWWLPRGSFWSWTVNVLHECRIVVVGGAYSVDRDRRVEGVSVFKELECPLPEELELAKSHGQAHIMLCHDHPDFGYQLAGTKTGVSMQHVLAGQNVRKQLREVADVVNPSLVVHGHWHYDYEHEARIGEGADDFKSVVGISGNRESETLNWVDLAQPTKVHRKLIQV